MVNKLIQSDHLDIDDVDAVLALQNIPLSGNAEEQTHHVDTNNCQNVNNDDDDNDGNNDVGNDDDDDDDDENHDDDGEDDDSDEEFVPIGKKNRKLILITQTELNDLMRDLKLPKDGSEYLASFLKNRSLLSKRTTSSFYRQRDKEFRKYFKEEDEEKRKLVYCNDVNGLMEELKPGMYKNDNWRLFIDSSKRSLKTVLLHNTQTFLHQYQSPTQHS